jgi:hypothetical protein
VDEPPQHHTPPWLRRRRIARFEMVGVAACHLLVAGVLLAWPREQIVTPGTSVIFGTFPVPVWAAWFAATGLAAASCAHRNTELRQALTWIGTFPLGVAWCYGFAVALGHGRGNPVFLLTYAFLLFWWFALAVRLFVGGTGTRWDGTS